MFLWFLFPYYLQGPTEKHLGDVGTLDKYSSSRDLMSILSEGPRTKLMLLVA